MARRYAWISDGSKKNKKSGFTTEKERLMEERERQNFCLVI